MTEPLQIALEDTCRYLESIFESNKQKYMRRPGANFKIRLDWLGYDKFYLDWVEGSYDMSLQLLIQHILYKNGHFNKLLSEETYSEVSAAFMEAPPL